MTSTKTPSIQIKCNADLKERFITLQKTLNAANYDDLLDILLNAYQTPAPSPEIELNEDEQKEVNSALTNGKDYSAMLKTGLLSEVRKANSQASKLEAIKEELKTGSGNTSSTIAGIALVRVANAVNQLIEHNDNQTESNQKWFIGKGSVQGLCNANMPKIVEYFDANASLIESHNAKHSLNENSNRGRKGRNVKEILSKEVA